MPRSDSTSPEARAATELARSFDRVYKEPADILAAIERDVSEPETRDRLGAMIRQRHEERMEIHELDDLEAPDERTRLERIVDVLPIGVWVILVILLIIPRLVPSALVSLVVAAAVVAVVTVAGALAIHRRRVRSSGDWRLDLLARAGLITLPAVVGGIHSVAPSLRVGREPLLAAGLVAQGAAVVVLLLLALGSPTAARFAQRRDEQSRSDRSPDVIEYERSVERIDELERAYLEDGPGMLRAALADRDPVTARSTRGAVVEAIRVLYELEQIGDDEAEWMLREALG